MPETTTRRKPGRPPWPGPRKIRRNFRLDPEVNAMLDRLAEATGGDRTAALEHAVRTAAALAGIGAGA